MTTTDDYALVRSVVTVPKFKSELGWISGNPEEGVVGRPLSSSSIGTE